MCVCVQNNKATFMHYMQVHDIKSSKLLIHYNYEPCPIIDSSIYGPFKCMYNSVMYIIAPAMMEVV